MYLVYINELIIYLSNLLLFYMEHSRHEIKAENKEINFVYKAIIL